MFQLQDEVGTFDNSLAFSIIEKELGAKATDIFDFDSFTPIASESHRPLAYSNHEAYALVVTDCYGGVCRRIDRTGV
jgi:hypothetical protein